MRYFLIVLCVLTRMANNCQAQDTVTRSVTLFSESPKVDSLISSVIHDNSTHSKPAKNDSCFLLELSKDNNLNFIQGIRASNKKNLVFDYVDFEKYKSLGYFQFNGYLVFIYGKPIVNELFQRTESKKEFHFVKIRGTELMYMLQNYISWAVFYENGELGYGMH